jgi:membrane associated rhomboid family serine protease
VPRADAPALPDQRVHERLEHEDRSPETMSEEELDEIYFEVAMQMDRHPHPDWRMLYLGGGIWPWQWVTANFMHADIFHLLGNMIFLWGIGVVIEGKLGWWRFLSVYLLIGTIGYGFVQIIMLWAEPNNALGASLPIYGIMMLALIWAPLNDLQCVLIMAYRPIFLDVKILYFVAGYLVLQVAIFIITRMNMGSEALHLIGAFVGLPIGLYMLKAKMVDCEDWDVFSVWTGRNELTREERAQLDESRPEHVAKVVSKKDAFTAQIQQILDEQQNPVLAWAAHLKMQHRFADWQLPEKVYRSLIRLYHQQGKKAESLPAMLEFLRKYPGERSLDMRLVLAQYMIREAERPRQGLLLLEGLNGAPLNETQQHARAKLLQMAQRRKAEVELEEPVEDW